MPTYKPESADDLLAEETGKPAENFSADEKPIPRLEELESIPEEDW